MGNKMGNNKRNNKTVYIAAFLATLLIGTTVVISCKDRFFTTHRIDTITLPLTPLFQSYPNYLISNESYMRFFEEKKIDSEVLGIIRKGEAFVLIKAEGDDGNGYSWYQIRNANKTGWVLTLDPLLVYSFEKAKQFQKILSINSDD